MEFNQTIKFGAVSIEQLELLAQSIDKPHFGCNGFSLILHALPGTLGIEYKTSR